MKKINLIVVVLIVVLISINQVSAEICECNSCKSCTEKLSNDSCNEVRLVSDINILSQEEGIFKYNLFRCICPIEFNNKIFDCQGHEIKGNSALYGSKGIYFLESSPPRSGITLVNNNNNTLKNCIISGFSDGIGIGLNASNNKIMNNTFYINNEGIILASSSNNSIINNSIYKDNVGITIVNASHNLIANNTIHSNLKGIMTHFNANFNKISHNKIFNNTENGIFMSLLGNCYKRCTYQGSTGNELSNNKITGNNVGIKSVSSNFTADSNFVCGNGKDFEVVYSVVGEGNDNVCDNPNGWNDSEKKGCTYKCSEQKPPDNDTEPDYNFILAIAIILSTILLSAFIIRYKKFKK